MLALMLAAALAPCSPETPPALELTGIPAVAIPGRAYTARLVGDGEVVERAGADIGVYDARGRGWNAHYGYARGVTQAFSVGLAGPYTVRAAWTEPDCTRTVSVPVPVERRIEAVVNCRRGALEPRSGLVLRCHGARLRVRNLKWRDWNASRTVGHGSLAGRPATVTLSAPRECTTLDAYIYTRARLTSGSRTLKSIPIDCPLP